MLPLLSGGTDGDKPVARKRTHTLQPYYGKDLNSSRIFLPNRIFIYLSHTNLSQPRFFPILCGNAHIAGRNIGYHFAVIVRQIADNFRRNPCY